MIKFNPPMCLTGSQVDRPLHPSAHFATYDRYASLFTSVTRRTQIHKENEFVVCYISPRGGACVGFKAKDRIWVWPSTFIYLSPDPEIIPRIPWGKNCATASIYIPCSAGIKHCDHFCWLQGSLRASSALGRWGPWGKGIVRDSLSHRSWRGRSPGHKGSVPQG